MAPDHGRRNVGIAGLLQLHGVRVVPVSPDHRPRKGNATGTGAADSPDRRRLRTLLEWAAHRERRGTSAPRSLVYQPASADVRNGTHRIGCAGDPGLEVVTCLK